MKKSKALIILESFQKWRRSEPPYEESGSLEYTPTEIGKAIDYAIQTLKKVL